MLVMIKTISYKRTVAVCASMDFREDLSLEVTAGGLGGGRTTADSVQCLLMFFLL